MVVWAVGFLNDFFLNLPAKRFKIMKLDDGYIKGSMRIYTRCSSM